MHRGSGAARAIEGRIALVATLAVALSTSACVPEVADGQFACGAGSGCPRGFSCAPDGVCRREPDLRGSDGADGGRDAAAAPSRDVDPGEADTATQLVDASTGSRWSEALRVTPTNDCVDGGSGCIGELLIDRLDPRWIATGPDGALWFSEPFARRVGRLTPSGEVRWIKLTGSEPLGLVAGPDGRMWIGQADDAGMGGHLAQISPDGTVSELPIPSAGWAITLGPDGNLWLAMRGVFNLIGRVNVHGVGVFFPSGDMLAGAPYAITAGPDDNLWFTLPDEGMIASVTPFGLPGRTHVLPDPASAPLGIAAGPDGHLWFTEAGTGRIGRLSPDGELVEIDLPTPGLHPRGIALGADGNLWFTAEDRIGRITAALEVSEFPLPRQGTRAWEITAARDGKLWFTEAPGDAIGFIQP